MATSRDNRPDPKPAHQPQRSDAGKTDASPLTTQESGASGGPPPTSDELAGRSDGAKAGQSAPQTSAPKRPGVDPNNASQHEVQGSADADADHESGDQSEGTPKRMD